MHNRKLRNRTLAIAVVGLAGAFALPVAAVQSSTAAAQAAVAAATDPGLARLRAEIERLAEIAGGEVGVGVIHLESGREAYLNRGERFPMASSYKVPIAVQLLTRVDRGELRLDSMIALQPGDLHPGSGTLTELFDDPGVVLSLRNLLELMLLISDNSATDLVLKTAGGPAAVTGRMRSMGLGGVRVDRPTVRLISDWIGIEDLPSDDVSPAEFRELAEAVAEVDRSASAAVFDANPRDTSTPEAMVALLARIWSEEVLSPGSSELLLDIMERSTTGTERIKGMLPPGTDVAHKTGTIGGTTNDVGIIQLPDGAGHVAIAVFVKKSERSVETRERAIAQISRAVYDFFLFTAVPARAASLPSPR
ncbi:MAG: class A beta-lactamase [Longimicrobiaceae bacterium]